MWLELRALLAVNAVLLLSVWLAFVVLFGFRDLGFVRAVMVAFALALIPVTWLWYRGIRRETAVPVGPMTRMLERRFAQVWSPPMRALVVYLESLLWGAMTAALTSWAYLVLSGLTGAGSVDVGWLRLFAGLPVLAVVITWPLILTFSPCVLLAWRWALHATRSRRRA